MRTVVASSRNNGYSAFKRGEHCDVHVNDRGWFKIGRYTVTLDDGTKIFRCPEHVFTDLKWTEDAAAEMKWKLAEPESAWI